MPTLTLTTTRTITVPEYGQRIDGDELVSLVRGSGSHFFDPDTMRFFKSRLHDVFSAPDGWYFITSEKHESPYSGINEPRKYTVRRLSVNAEGNDLELLELEAFQHFPTLNRARTAAKHASKEPMPVCTKCQLRLTPNGICEECRDRESRRVSV